MLLGFILSVLGICIWVSFHLAFLALRSGENPWLFISFGLFFSIPVLIFGVKWGAERWPALRRIEKNLFEHSEPRVTFVPHWFMMAALALAGAIVMAAILVPVFFE